MKYKNINQIHRIYFYIYIIKYIQITQACIGDPASCIIYQYDPNGNITAITNNLDPTKNKTYAYDTLNKLNTANGPWGTIQYTYDSVGNRQTETTNTGVTNYTYTANKLTASTGEKTFSFNYDSNGNTTLENNRQYIYNQNQRLINAVENGVTTAAYMYDGNGQRAGKATSAGTTIFHYDLNGNLIAESTLSGTITAEYVYLYGQPIAKIEGNNIYYYHNDHLSTPQKMTDSAGSVVWYGEFKPFGEPVSITGTITNNLRFPGQYYDSETGNNYNYYRDYKPQTGRYIQKDPIGLRGGVNLYAYVANNPMNWIDPYGLLTALEALEHYKNGKGVPLKMPFSEINISGIKPSHFTKVETELRKPCSNRNITIDDQMIFTTSGDQRYFLGNITLRLQGTLKIMQDGTWSFEGILKSFDDYYDFNKSTHRSLLGEVLTTFGRNTTGTPYWIEIRGTKSISEIGTIK